jgi:nucleotide-binding universal stress UspA family protein
MEAFMKVLTIYDGTIQSKTALHYGIGKVKDNGGELIVLHVFPSALFIDYDAGPKAEEIARAEAKQHLLEAENIIRETGKSVPIHLVMEEGDPEQELLRVAEAEKPELILATPRYKAVIKKVPYPVYVMPGTILVPVDNSEALITDAGKIAKEAKASGSKVLLLGIVPVHIYGTEEKHELDQVQKTTVAAVKKIKKALHNENIGAEEIIRSGYPDEEILKAADEYGVSLIMLPAGGKTPSELAKAAAILLDEPERLKRPVYVMPPVEA